MNSILKRAKAYSVIVFSTALSVGLTFLMSNEAHAATTAGTLIQNTADNLPDMTKLVAAISYVMGAMAVAVGVYKARDWSNSPQQTKISEPFKFLGAGGLLVAAPAFAAAITRSIGIDPSTAGIESGNLSAVDGRVDVFQTVAGANGLDDMVISLMRDITGPMSNLLLGFAYMAGAIMIIVGLNRLTKSSQEGARGPSGLGTMATFITGAILLSSSQVMRSFSETIFGTGGSEVAVYTDIMGLASTVPVQHAENVISAVLLFMIIVGTISFLRGIFVLRGFAEGNSQMSLMGGLSHIIAGILAVNLGQFMNVIQETLGISPSATGVEIIFS
jgi:hypothetical protein